MSRTYEMIITISNYNPAKKNELIEACRNDWEIKDKDIWEESGRLSCFGRSYLVETEEEFVDHLAGEIWEANGGFCDVFVEATFLDDLPSGDHERGLQDYQKWTQTKRLLEEA